MNEEGDTPPPTSKFVDRRHGERRKVDDNYKEIREEFRKFIRRGFLGWALIGATSAIAIFGFGFVLRDQARQNNDIQRQRYATIYSLCIQQNHQHDRAVIRAQNLAPRNQLGSVIAIIDELRPVVDCRAYADAQVRGLKRVP